MFVEEDWGVWRGAKGKKKKEKKVRFCTYGKCSYLYGNTSNYDTNQDFGISSLAPPEQYVRRSHTPTIDVYTAIQKMLRWRPKFIEWVLLGGEKGCKIDYKLGSTSSIHTLRQYNPNSTLKHANPMKFDALPDSWNFANFFSRMSKLRFLSSVVFFFQG